MFYKEGYFSFTTSFYFAPVCFDLLAVALSFAFLKHIVEINRFIFISYLLHFHVQMRGCQELVRREEREND